MPIDFAAIRAAVSVGDVLVAHGHELRRDGRMPCPICGSGNPSSLSTYASGRRWRCWSCGARGDAVDLEAALGGVDVGTASRRLAAQAGLAAGPRPTGDCVRRARVRRQREGTLRRWAALRCRDAIDAARMWDSIEHRLSITGAAEIDAMGAPSDATLDGLARVYGARDRAERDVDWYAAADLRDMADEYHDARGRAS